MERHFPIKPCQPIYRNDSYQILVLFQIPQRNLVYLIVEGRESRVT